MRRLGFAGLMVVFAGCGVRGEVPPGVTCARWTQAAGDSALAEALAGATSGTCVVAQTGKYSQALSVPAGVTLVGEAGGVVELSGGTDVVPVVSLAPNAVLAWVEVTATAAGVGVAGAGKGQRLFRVNVKGVKKVGVVFWCEEDCRTDDFSEVIETTVSGAAVGLMTNGVRLRLKGGALKKSGGTSLTSGYGLVASAGAVLEVDGTVIDENESLGVLIDGAGATEASLTNVSVRDNKGRGVWAQGLLGTMTSPAVKLINPTIERNRLVGFGARRSTGVSLTGGRIAGTLVGAAVGPAPGVLVMVGDGIGVHEGTGAMRVEGAALEANQRAQALLDTVAAGVSFAPNVTVASAGALGIVLQRSMVTVEAPQVTNLGPGMELSVSAPALGLPAR